MKKYLGTLLWTAGVLVCVISFGACGKKDEKKAVSASSTVHVQEPVIGTAPGAGTEFKESSSESYLLISNGCETGTHVFKNADRATTLKQLCSALKDDELNQGCAQCMRREKFKLRCADVDSWAETEWSKEYCSDGEDGGGSVIPQILRIPPIPTFPRIDD